MRWLILGLAVLPSVTWAVSFVEVEAMRTGGFFAEGAKMNDFAHQNYFVGYGTTPGFSRTAERRSFFYFEIPEIEGTIVGAKLTLKLLFSTSLIFGLGPGDPPPDPPVKDSIESFALGLLPVSPGLVLDPGLTPSEVVTLFGMMDDAPVATPVDFLLADPPGFPSLVDIPLSPSGSAIVGASEGGSLILSGWMPTFSYDTRLAPGGSSLYETSELIFGFSDVTGPSGSLVPKPVLTISYEPVPEPHAIAIVGLGLVAMARRRRART